MTGHKIRMLQVGATALILSAGAFTFNRAVQANGAVHAPTHSAPTTIVAPPRAQVVAPGTVIQPQPIDPQVAQQVLSGPADGRDYFRFLRCLEAHGATYIASADGTYTINASQDANAACAYLEAASVAAARASTATVEPWLLKLGARSAGFWQCIGRAGFEAADFTQPVNGEVVRSFAEAAFYATATSCARQIGTTLPRHR